MPLTNNLDDARLPSSYRISRTQNNGLEAYSVALILQIRSLTMATSRFLFRMGSVEQEHFKKIKTLIKDYLKIE